MLDLLLNKDSNSIFCISEIANQKELKLALSSFDMPYINIPLVCENDGSGITTARDWVVKRIDFLRKSSR